MLRQRSLGVSPSVSRMFFAEAAMFAPDSGTIFGREVVPEVWRTSAMSSGSRQSRCASGRSNGIAGEAESTGGRAGTCLQTKNRKAKLLRNSLSRLVPPGVDHQGAGAKVGQVELEFLRPVDRVEGRGGGAGGDRHKGSSHLRAVRKNDRDTIISTYPERVEARDRIARELSKGFKAERRAIRR